MATTLTPDLMAASDKQITDTVLRETARLRSFIRQRMADANEAEDVLQDVFQELVEASRLPEPIEQVGAWLFRVARNRIVDRFRKKKEQQLPEAEELGDDDDSGIDDLLPQADAGPEAAYARSILLDALQDALDELPPKQREVFIAHELERRSFKQLAAESGESVNTLLARKRYAVLHLRLRLQEIYDEFDL
ncbi:sigma-70 family RNA polymerase sigma factor [Collimonas sp.]|jgi:RNA polymerase sigma factor (sigma-70 family)|uniref:RNA polymerase sigma factor n=1 Tax=Collimonas sp. TaxID=1963772 RepID=UPI002BC438D7|nr:sigma-70 family RNA polymerase sigma factor [Collimonas sp.]HWX03919.1 sigma-70 family RNA polymerase sigma factor [Collimonas sp.]